MKGQIGEGAPRDRKQHIILKNKNKNPKVNFKIQPQPLLFGRIVFSDDLRQRHDNSNGFRGTTEFHRQPIELPSFLPPLPPHRMIWLQSVVVESTLHYTTHNIIHNTTNTHKIHSISKLSSIFMLAPFSTFTHSLFSFS